MSTAHCPSPSQCPSLYLPASPMSAVREQQKMRQLDRGVALRPRAVGRRRLAAAPRSRRFTAACLLSGALAGYHHDLGVSQYSLVAAAPFPWPTTAPTVPSLHLLCPSRR